MSRSLSTSLFVLALAVLGLALRWVAQGASPGGPPTERPPYVLPVTLDAVARGRLQPRAALTGSVLATERAPLGFRLAGRLAALEVREGETVARGAVLARLEDDDQRVTLARAQATLDLAVSELTLAEAGEREEERLRLSAELDQRRAEAELAASNVERNRELLGTSVIAQSSYDALLANSKAAQARVVAAEQVLVRAQRGARPEELAIRRAQVALRQSEVEIARNDLEKCTLRAPFDASVVARLASLGETAAAGRAVYELVDLASREIELEVPSGLAARLSAGAGVLLTLDERPDFVLRTRVDALIVAADAVSRNFRALVRLDVGEDADVRLKPGMFVRAEVDLEAFEDVWLVDEDALRVVEAGTIVVRAAATPPGADGAPAGLAAEWVAVRVLGTQDGRAAVESLGAPLQAGDALVITGVDLAFPGAALLPTGSAAVEVAPVNPIRYAVEQPYTVAVGVLLTMLFSALAYRNIPVQLKPTVDRPLITIATDFRGASAVEVEEQVTRELEDVLQSVEGLLEMTSDSSEGRSQITLEYEFGTDTALAVVDVINKLSRVQGLPPEADQPEVEVASSDSGQVMWISLISSYAPDRVRRLVKDEVESRLKRVYGVSELLVVGGSENEIQVRIDPEQMVAHGVTYTQLGAALARGNVNVRGGTLETGTRQAVVRTVGRALEPAALGELIVAEGPGGSVRLADLGRVVDTYRETAGFVNISGVPGVAVGISRKSGTNVVELIEQMDAACVEQNEIFASRGLDVRLEPVYRETTYIQAAMDFVQGNLLVGSFLAVVVLALFLRDVRSVLIVALSIPISLAAVFLVLQGLGRTLNVISLAGLAFASGMVVDNAIVVLENIFRLLELGRTPKQASIEGGREVWGGVLGSTLTTIAVFVPILLAADEASQLFIDIAIAISAAVGISLVVSLTVVPVLTALLLKPSDKLAVDGITSVSLGWFGRGYASLVRRITRSRALGAKFACVALLTAFSVASLRITPPAEYLPTGNRNLVMFFAAPIPGTRPEQVRDNFGPFERFILAQPEAGRMFAVTGQRFNGGGVILKDEYADAEHLDAFYGKLFGPASKLPGFQFVVPVRASLFEDPGKQFEVELSGPEFATLEKASADLTARLQAVEGVQFVRSSLVTGRPELRVTVDEKKAKSLGLSVEDVGQVVETAVAGRRLTALVAGGRDVDVNVLVPPERIASPQDLRDLRFVAPGGQVVALGSVAEVTRTSGPQSVRRLERERNVLLTVNIAATAPLETVVDTIERDVFPALGAQLGPAYTLRVGGSADKLKATLASISAGFGLSVLIIYLLLVSLFQSWISPLVILTTVPLALAGGLLGITLAHQWSGQQASFDVIAMLGFVILAGLVVNNAILIIHQAGNFRAEGKDARTALELSASSRLRPILMTVITTVIGMLPLAIGGGAGAELYQGLGAVIVGGLVVSTLFTLVLVPVLVSIGFDLQERFAPRGVGAQLQALPQ